ncbi:hypothetical protein BaRGS_00023260 [Batillaria attramentaria]|uniref:Uncharacterized protein n=1 Tax=Batillaria attramentaria TaxID=370345 RepID=A0ABD0KEQ7_9CAEN
MTSQSISVHAKHCLEDIFQIPQAVIFIYHHPFLVFPLTKPLDRKWLSKSSDTVANQKIDKMALGGHLKLNDACQSSLETDTQLGDSTACENKIAAKESQTRNGA